MEAHQSSVDEQMSADLAIDGITSNLAKTQTSTENSEWWLVKLKYKVWTHYVADTYIYFGHLYIADNYIIYYGQISDNSFAS